MSSRGNDGRSIILSIDIVPALVSSGAVQDLEAQLATAENQLGDLGSRIARLDEEAKSLREELASSRATEAELGSALESLNQVLNIDSMTVTFLDSFRMKLNYEYVWPRI